MASPVRQESDSGFYHVVQRGVNCFDIFEDDEDRSFFMETLAKSMQAYQVEVHAWCLMSNHFHLLLKAGYKDLSAMMRRLSSIYAKYFNKRYGRNGPLFGGRFKSVCPKTDVQLIAVARYIHRNPIEHEKEVLAGNYRWSSYKEYVSGAESVCHTSFLMDLFGGESEFIRIHEEEWPFERHLDIGSFGRMSDEEVRALADAVLKDAGIGVGVSQIGTLTREVRDKAIALVKQVVDCSYRQLQRLTAISYSIIRKAIAVVTGEEEAIVEVLASAMAFPPNPELAFSMLLPSAIGCGDAREGVSAIPL